MNRLSADHDVDAAGAEAVEVERVGDEELDVHAGRGGAGPADLEILRLQIARLDLDPRSESLLQEDREAGVPGGEVVEPHRARPGCLGEFDQGKPRLEEAVVAPERDVEPMELVERRRARFDGEARIVEELRPLSVERAFDPADERPLDRTRAPHLEDGMVDEAIELGDRRRIVAEDRRRQRRGARRVRFGGGAPGPPPVIGERPPDRIPKLGDRS